MGPNFFAAKKLPVIYVLNLSSGVKGKKPQKHPRPLACAAKDKEEERKVIIPRVLFGKLDKSVRKDQN
jgi:hypothetical protein